MDSIIWNHPYRHNVHKGLSTPHETTTSQTGRKFVVYYESGSTWANHWPLDTWNDWFTPIVFETKEGA